MFWWWVSISFQVCQSFLKFLRNFALHDFLISGAVIFLRTYQGEEVGVAVFQGGSVCLKVDVSHCSHILFTFPHFTSFWDVLEGLKTRKSKKMCLSSYSLMAVGETHNKLKQGRALIGRPPSQPCSHWSKLVTWRAQVKMADWANWLETWWE